MTVHRPPAVTRDPARPAGIGPDGRRAGAVAQMSPAMATRLASLKARPRRAHEASIFFHEPTHDCLSVKLLPGEFFVGDGSVALTTTLGSCVATCLHDAGTGLGGMNHFMLPDSGDPEAGGRYGVYAMELLVNELIKRGARRHALEAKIFGGGQVMRSLAGTLIGAKNVAFARGFLDREGIPLRGSDVLGTHPRKVFMFPETGRVLCRRLPPAADAESVALEARYRAELGQPHGGDVELFT